MTIKILISALCLLYVYVAIKTIIKIHKDTKRADEIIEQLIMELVWSQHRQENVETLEQKSKQGKWVQAKDIEKEYAVCTNCKHHGEFYMDYCPNCGAKMESDEE